ncbi:MAG: hypothetical protein LBI67_00210 [Treponema sp.]|nr:hypothetical protein [Treponema sp.]
MKKTAKKQAKDGKTGSRVKTKARSKTEKLAAELKSLIPRLDEEGLLFLVEQAQIHLYNMQVEELNESRARTEAVRAEGQAGRAVSGGGRTPGFSIRVSDDKQIYYLVYKDGWIMLNSGETASLVKIASSPASGEDKKAALYRWFDRERRDFFGLAPIKSPQSEILLQLAELFRKLVRK